MVVLVAWFATGWSQGKTGKLTGKITDNSTNQVLTGVSVVVKGNQKGTTTTADGTYVLPLAPGNYTIRFSYTGYKTKEISGIEIKANDATYLDIVLEQAGELAGVVVTSTVRKESQSSVYSAQKRSSAVSDGISQEAIRRTPDNDGAQVLRRVTGVNIQDNRFVVVRGLSDQYNQTMVNGVPVTSTESNRNAFAFDLIPAAAIDNITINKTATPDMPGNFAGGVVQVNTRDFPANDFLSLSLQTGYNDETFGRRFYGDRRGRLEWMAISDRYRRLPREFPTLESRTPFAALNIQEKFRLLRQLPNNLAPVDLGYPGLNQYAQLGAGKSWRLKNSGQLGLIAAFSQRQAYLTQEEETGRTPNRFSETINPNMQVTPDVFDLIYYSENRRYAQNSDLGAVLNLAYRQGNNRITLKNLYTRIFTNLFIDRPILFYFDSQLANPNLINRGLSYFVEEKQILNSVLAGEHRLGAGSEAKLDWNLAITRNGVLQPDTRNFVLRTDTSLSKDPSRWIYQVDENTSFIRSLEFNSRVWSQGRDLVLGGAVNLTGLYRLGREKHVIKGGLLFQNRDRRFSGFGVPIQGINHTLDSAFAPSSYGPSGVQAELSVTNFLADIANYNAGSSLLAAYASSENRIKDKLRVIWGLRVENYQQQVLLPNTVFYPGFPDPVLGVRGQSGRSSFDFLPSVNIVYSPFKSINLRGGISSTVIRPELRDIADVTSFDFQTLNITQGNAQLRSAAIRNYDLKLEWFPSAGEIVSLAAYHKDMFDPIEYARPTTGAGFNSPGSLRRPLNVGDAYVSGLEAEVRKKIDFVPFAPWLRNITVFGNGALLRSKVSTKPVRDFLFDTVLAHPLTGQPDYLINAGVNVQALKQSFELTLSYNRTGDFITELGAFRTVSLLSGTQGLQVPHFLQQGRDNVDLVVTKSFVRNRLRIRAAVGNLTKTRLVFYQDVNGNRRLDEAIKIFTGDASGTFQQLQVISGIDVIASRLNAQRNYSFSVNYTFQK